MLRSDPEVREGMKWVPGGTFRMGSDRHYPEEAPAHDVRVDGFWMDAAPVTTAEFARFVEATGHVTLAERIPDPADYPGALPDMIFAGSLVFTPPPGPVPLDNVRHWWSFLQGASWKHPTGPDSDTAGLDEHPVVHIAFADADAYARWAGKELPTEAEWERAARGGLDGREFAWGDELEPFGRPMANTWHGSFPWRNSRRDGYDRTSPVRAFPPNGFGVWDMIGNTWEWTADWYQPQHVGHSGKPCCIPSNPRGGEIDDSYDSRQPAIHIPRKVLKGGSHLCAPSYCRRYRPAARHAQPVDTSTSHVGFRCVSRAAPAP